MELYKQSLKQLEEEIESYREEYSELNKSYDKLKEKISQQAKWIKHAEYKISVAYEVNKMIIETGRRNPILAKELRRMEPKLKAIIDNISLPPLDIEE